VKRFLLPVVVLLVLGLASVVWFRVIEPLKRHRLFCDHVRAELTMLAKKRPANVTRKQWENVVAWTLNAHANCITYERNMPPEDMEGFETELHQRLQGEVNLATIDWIWDEIIRLTSIGQRYSDYYRPTLPRKLKEFEEENMRWGIEVD
jgi:hypothetical protein